MRSSATTGLFYRDLGARWLHDDSRWRPSKEKNAQKRGWRISAGRAPQYLSGLERAGNAVRAGGFARGYINANDGVLTHEMPYSVLYRSCPVRPSVFGERCPVSYVHAPPARFQPALPLVAWCTHVADAACPPMCTLVINRIVNSRSPSCWHTLSLLGSAMRTESAHAHADGLPHRMLTASLKAC